MVLFKRLLEIGCLFILVEICIWCTWPQYPVFRWIYVAGIAAAMAMCCAMHKDTPELLGFKPAKGGAWHVIAVGVTANLVVLVALGLAYNRTDMGSFEDLALRTLYYLPWAFVQQLAASSFFTNRLASAFGRGHAWETSMTSGALFAVAHIPNPVLFVFAFVNGVLGARIFMSYRNMYALTVAHAILGPAVELFLPEAWHKGLAIGPGFFI